MDRPIRSSINAYERERNKQGSSSCRSNSETLSPVLQTALQRVTQVLLSEVLGTANKTLLFGREGRPDPSRLPFHTHIHQLIWLPWWLMWAVPISLHTALLLTSAHLNTSMLTLMLPTIVSSWLDVLWEVEHSWYTRETVERKKPSNIAVVDTLKLVRLDTFYHTPSKGT